jgi:hypothetical protein
MQFVPAASGGGGSLTAGADLVLTASDFTSLSVNMAASSIELTGSHPSLTTLVVTSSSLVTLSLTGATALRDVSFSGISDLTTVIATGLALTQASVDAIIAACLVGGAVGGALNISGGTNAAPSAAGDADIVLLQGSGWTVTTN